MSYRERQIRLAMRYLVEYLSEDLIEYWNTIEDSEDLDPFRGSVDSSSIAEVIIELDNLINSSRAIKRLYKELDYFKDHRKSLEQYINQGR